MKNNKQVEQASRAALERARAKIQKAAETLFRAKEEARRVLAGQKLTGDIEYVKQLIDTACQYVAYARSCTQKAAMAETKDRMSWYTDQVQKNCRIAAGYAEKALHKAKSALAKATDPRRPFIERAEDAWWWAASANQTAGRYAQKNDPRRRRQKLTRDQRIALEVLGKTTTLLAATKEELAAAENSQTPAEAKAHAQQAEEYAQQAEEAAKQVEDTLGANQRRYRMVYQAQQAAERASERATETARLVPTGMTTATARDAARRALVAWTHAAQTSDQDQLKAAKAEADLAEQYAREAKQNCLEAKIAHETTLATIRA